VSAREKNSTGILCVTKERVKNEKDQYFVFNILFDAVGWV